MANVAVVQSSGLVDGNFMKIRNFMENVQISRNIGRITETRVTSALAARQACAWRGLVLRVVSRGHLFDGLPRASSLKQLFHISVGALTLNIRVNGTSSAWDSNTIMWHVICDGGGCCLIGLVKLRNVLDI